MLCDVAQHAASAADGGGLKYNLLSDCDSLPASTMKAGKSVVEACQYEGPNSSYIATRPDSYCCGSDGDKMKSADQDFVHAADK